MNRNFFVEELRRVLHELNKFKVISYPGLIDEPEYLWYHCFNKCPDTFERDNNKFPDIIMMFYEEKRKGKDKHVPIDVALRKGIVDIDDIYAIPVEIKRNRNINRKRVQEQLYNGKGFIENILGVRCPYGKLVLYGKSGYMNHGSENRVNVLFKPNDQGKYNYQTTEYE